MGLFFFARFFFSILSFAAEDVVQPTTIFDWSNLYERTNATYAALVLGPTLHKMNGDKGDGRGSFTSLRHYLSVDLEIMKDWIAESGVELRQYWRPEDKKNPTREETEMRDPYLGISRKNIIRGEVFSLGAKARFFFPLSNYNESKVGKSDDAGKGEVNAAISPAWKFFDGDLSFGLGTEIFVKIPENAPANREELSLRAKPLVSYRFTRKHAAKLEYQTGYLKRTTDKKWSKFNDRSSGQKLIASLAWMPTDALNLSPSLSWGSGRFRLRETEVGLYASYAFL